MNIIVDAFGGDNAPLEIVKGASVASKTFGVHISLVGKADTLEDVIKSNDIDRSNMDIIDASDIVSMSDDPMKAFKEKPDSSLIKGLKTVADGKGDAFISAGNSGALVVGATFIVGRIKGLKRVAFAPVMPNLVNSFMLIDGGANVSCHPEMLKQFAIMGSIYMNHVMHIDNPKVGLANIGVEEHKGTKLQVETYQLLKECDRINFAGNIEVRDLPITDAGVIVSDGFTGNIILKTYEGVALSLLGSIKKIIATSGVDMGTIAPIAQKMGGLKTRLDYNKYGGAPIMGLKAPVFKAHGNSNADTIKNAIGLVSEYVKSNVVKQIENEL